MSYTTTTIRKIEFIDVIEGRVISTLEIDEEFTGRTPDKKLKELTDVIFHKLTKQCSPQRIKIIEA